MLISYIEMPDYQKGKIYKVVSNTVEGTYYGSTADELWSRFGKHKKDYNQWKKGKYPYVTSFKLIEAGDAEIILVEKYPCNDKIELKARERWYIENNECVNKCVPNRTVKEYYQDNKGKISEYQKEYYQNNKEKIKEQYQDNREKLKEYRKLTFQCPCDGNQHNLHGRARHFRTQYHITNFKSICDIHGIDPNDIDPRDFK
jgi:hypothetical protein